jgi:glycosyltransferase involved in cell wall biosynthesis
LLAALEDQSLPRDEYEIVVVDNGSRDISWRTLQALVAQSSARVLGTTLPENRGPGGGRNHAVGYTRAPLIVFTDDDCLPTPTWLEQMLAAFDAGADLIQGQVHADPVDRAAAGPWYHTKWITVPTPFFETCNVGYRREYFEKVGGFDENDPLTASLNSKAFGEDAVLAWRVKEAGGEPRFVPESLVHHRNIPAFFHDQLVAQRRLVGFPGLGQRSGFVADSFWHGIFLTRENAAFDLAVLSVLNAVLTRKPVFVAGVLPWLRLRWPEAMRRAGHPDTGIGGAHRPRAVVRLGQLAVMDAVSLASLLRGSIRHRRILL